MNNQKKANEMSNFIVVLPSLNNRISPIKGGLLLAKYLYDNGFKIKLISLKKLDHDKDDYPFEAISLNMNNFFDLLRARSTLIKELNYENSVTIFSFTLFPDLLVSTIYGLNKVSFVRAYLIDQYREDFPFIGFLLTRLHSIILKKFSYVVAMTDSMRLQIISLGIKPERVLVNKNSIDTSAVRKIYNNKGEIEQKKTVTNISIAGSLTKRKRMSDAILAITMVQHPVRLNIYGLGPEQESLAKLAKQENVSDKVIFHGFIEDLTPELSKADIILSTSLSEGVSRVLIEAMAIGKTVIASNLPGSIDLIEHGKTGYIYNRTNFSELAKTINFVIHEDKYIDEQMLQKYMMNNHDYNICYKTLIERII